MANNLQRCSKCRRLLPFTEFHKSKNGKNGLKNQCKECIFLGIKEHPRSAYSKKYYKEHREELVASQRERRKKNPSYTPNWKKENYQRVLEMNRNYRARRQNSVGVFTADEWNTLVDLCDHRCLGCGCKPKNLTADHVVPLSVGGKNFISNIQPLCRSCNSRKKATVLDYRPSHVIEWVNNG